MWIVDCICVQDSGLSDKNVIFASHLVCPSTGLVRKTTVHVLHGTLYIV